MFKKTVYSILAAGVLLSAQGVSAMEKHSTDKFIAIPLGAEEPRDMAAPKGRPADESTAAAVITAVPLSAGKEKVREATSRYTPYDQLDNSGL